jgi:hypothetical protein
MLIAAIRSGSPLAGKAVSFSEEDGKFWLTGVGEIPPERLLEYEQAGELEWADDATRSWAMQRAGGEETVSPLAPPAAPSVEPPAAEPPQAASLAEADRLTVPKSAEPEKAAEQPPAAVISAPLARRKKHSERPEFVDGEKQGWRPSEVQWRIAGYVAIALAMIAIVVVMSIWRQQSDEPADNGGGSTRVVMQLKGSSAGESEPFDLLSGTHRLTFTAEPLDAEVLADFTFAVVPADIPGEPGVDYTVEQGLIDPNFASGTRSGEVVFEREAGSYILTAVSTNCSWTAEVSTQD